MRTLTFKPNGSGTYSIPPAPRNWTWKKIGIEFGIGPVIGVIGLLCIALYSLYKLVRKGSAHFWVYLTSDLISVAAVVLLLAVGLNAWNKSEMAANRAAAQLVADKSIGKELSCLATTLFWEGERGNVEDQRNIARTILTRMASGRYPSTVCGVVNQFTVKGNGTKVAQFSYIFDDRPAPSGKHWPTTRRIAAEELGKWYRGEHIAGSTNYHAPYVSPSWASQGVETCQLASMGKLGYHLHYATLSSAQAKACRTYKSMVATKAVKAEEKVEAMVKLPQSVPVPSPRPAKGKEKSDQIAGLLASL